MRKLKDDKQIKWKEAYTDRTNYLKDQFEDVIGPKSYFRFEGEQIDGSGRWYVIVGPAGVRNEHKAKFFCGIRKLPDEFPAGGVYFDNIVDAFNYARETWGVPKPEKMIFYNKTDLVGIT